eukprot:CAMPEP_0180785840 /NCGR_PEP_ID=MMETSP1038_2-20121128/50443_1 /TAXON_ID=632150 /ORGANISM="Azadinium spinosum, Strain 3D9" /LENGTH=54 /DNA_ID=CAMNT_0022822845 /DNA_START=15 /DNA_END=175 /DNA_ORIENTATION=-
MVTSSARVPILAISSMRKRPMLEEVVPAYSVGSVLGLPNLNMRAGIGSMMAQIA